MLLSVVTLVLYISVIPIEGKDACDGVTCSNGNCVNGACQCNGVYKLSANGKDCVKNREDDDDDDDDDDSTYQMVYNDGKGPCFDESSMAYDPMGGCSLWDISQGYWDCC